MSSRVGLSFLIVLSIFSAGCSEFLEGKKAEPEVIEFSDQRLVCLKDIPSHLKKFSVGEAQGREVRAGFDCMTEALRTFNKRTFGSERNIYSVDEMRRFFGKYFLKENNVTPEFAAELMKIKKALLGGSNQSISKDEIVRLIEILNVVRDEAADLAPHIKVLLSKNDLKKVEWVTITKATAQLRKSLQRLLVNTQIVNSEYSFEDAKKALSGMSEFIQGKEHFAPYDVYSEWVPVIEAVKNVLMGKRAHFADIYQWQDSLNTLIDLYELVLKFHYSLSDFKFEEPGKLRYASQFAKQSIELLLNTHQMKVTGRIPVEDIDNLIEKAVPKFALPVKISSLKKTYRVVLMKILDSERVSSSRSLVGLEKKHLQTLLEELNIWKLQQIFIDSIPYEKMGGGVTHAELLAFYGRYNKNSIIQKYLAQDDFEQKSLQRAWMDFGEVLKSPYIVSYNNQGRLIIDHRQGLLKQRWASLTKANIIRTLSRLLTLGYGDNTRGPLSAAVLSERGLVSWYEDFNEIGLDLKIFDPRSVKSGERSFLEANFFTFSGNGDQFMSQRETYEFVSTLFAAGLSISNAVSEHMIKARCAIVEKDIFGKPFMREACVKEQLRKHIGVYFNNMPAMVSYIQSLKPTQWDELYKHLFAASTVVNQKAGFVETANIRSMVTILHYVEAVMVVYDKDKNQQLSLGEVYSAAPRFTPFFRTISDTKSEMLLKEGFAYFVFKGKIPGATDLAQFQWEKLRGLEDVNRLNIMRLFGTLKEQLNKKKN